MYSDYRSGNTRYVIDDDLDFKIIATSHRNALSIRLSENVANEGQKFHDYLDQGRTYKVHCLFDETMQIFLVESEPKLKITKMGDM